MGGIDTVDAPEWRRCGLTQGERYEVRVRSRCTNLRSHTWSPWSAAGTALVPEPEPEPVGIGAVTAAAFEVSPNPAPDQWPGQQHPQTPGGVRGGLTPPRPP